MAKNLKIYAVENYKAHKIQKNQFGALTKPPKDMKNPNLQKIQ
jgi:hypothetical protein